MVENREAVVQKGLSEWWSEETEYVFQRIERWAAFARGYNRLRSQRWTKDRQSIQNHHDLSWNVSTQKPNVNDTACMPRFYSFKRSRRKSQSEETKINCCGTFNYQSNSQLDSNCLETYRYDHSIYFKTIGDIRSDKRDVGVIRNDAERVSINSKELIEWDASSLTDLLVDKLIVKDTRSNNHLNNMPDSVIETRTNRALQNAWPIVDLTKLDLDLMNTLRVPRTNVQDDRRGGEDQRENNNVDSSEVQITDSKTWKGKEDREDELKGNERTKRLRSFRKAKRSSRDVRRAPIVGKNNVVWPGVLLNYTNSFDVTNNPLHN